MSPSPPGPRPWTTSDAPGDVAAAIDERMMDVVLITMPWDALDVPSLQLGTLQAVLDRHGFSSRIRQLNLAFMEHLVAAASPDRPLSVDDYRLVATSFSGAGDWIFAIPPFRTPTAEGDAAFFAHLETRGLAA